jgi:hypothetical protein
MNTARAARASHDTIIERGSRSARVPNLSRDIRVAIAWERSEWEQAFQLVRQSYQAAGYEAASEKSLRFTLFHALPDTVTFVAKHEDRVVLTFSLVPDNTLLGLPMESVYGKEITALRRQGRRLAEVISFAAGNLGMREFPLVFRSIIRLIQQYHVAQGGDAWVITVNPKHRQFYTKVMGFVPLGPCCSYSRVQGAPAEAFLLDLDLMKANVPNTYLEMFGEPLPRSVLTAPVMPPALAREFARLSTQTNGVALDALLAELEHLGSPRRWPHDDQLRRPDEVARPTEFWGRFSAPLLA